MRRQAADAASRLLDRMDGGEGQLGGLIAGLRREASSVATGSHDPRAGKGPLPSAEAADDVPEPEPAATEPEPIEAEVVEEEVEGPEPGDERADADFSTTEAEEAGAPTPEPLQQAEAGSQEVPHGAQPMGKQGILGRLRRDRRSQRECAVCDRPAVGIQETLTSEGWALYSDAALCPKCRSEGWELSDDAPLPHRRP